MITNEVLKLCNVSFLITDWEPK